jgi:hypothetical protein
LRQVSVSKDHRSGGSIPAQGNLGVLTLMLEGGWALEC